jgi:hypothetical protein
MNVSSWPTFQQKILVNADQAPEEVFRKDPPRPTSNNFEVSHDILLAGGFYIFHYCRLG